MSTRNARPIIRFGKLAKNSSMAISVWRKLSCKPQWTSGKSSAGRPSFSKRFKVAELK
ncbi:Uncharacterised protein [Vibrio cholerae]|nr:Uncharacterised protein [Vibrio cholerae]CSC64788.1 Uncharacterised protein [Vibrio cholerae]